MNGLQQVVLGIGFVHQVVHHPLYNPLFIRGLCTESGSILTQEVLVYTSNDFPRTIPPFDGPLVDVLVQRILGSAEERAIDNVHIGIVTGFAQTVASVLCPEVVGQSIHGIKISEGALIRFRHCRQFFVEEEECQRFTVLAYKAVGTFHQLGACDGLQVSYGGEWFFGQLLVFRCRLLQFLISLLDAFLLEVLQFELAHNLLHNGTCEALAASWFAQYK